MGSINDERVKAFREALEQELDSISWRGSIGTEAALVLATCLFSKALGDAQVENERLKAAIARIREQGRILVRANTRHFNAGKEAEEARDGARARLAEVQEEHEECARVLISTRLLAAEKAAEWRTKLAGILGLDPETAHIDAMLQQVARLSEQLEQVKGDRDATERVARNCTAIAAKLESQVRRMREAIKMISTGSEDEITREFALRQLQEPAPSPVATQDGICHAAGLPRQAHVIPAGKPRCVRCFPEDLTK